MQTAISETESKSRDLNICVHHYTLRAPCPKGQGIGGALKEASGASKKPLQNAVMRTYACFNMFLQEKRLVQALMRGRASFCTSDLGGNIRLSPVLDTCTSS